MTLNAAIRKVGSLSISALERSEQTLIGFAELWSENGVPMGADRQLLMRLCAELQDASARINGVLK